MEAADQTSVMWNDKLWLSYFPLNAQTVMEYFSRSPFYDRSCLNEQYKMQGLDPSAFDKVPGVLYELILEREPSLFVIAQRRRDDNLQVSTLAQYYVLNGNAYQAPLASAVITSRIVQSMHHIKNAFQRMQEKVGFLDSGQYSWTESVPGVIDGELVVGDGAKDNDSYERRAIGRLLYSVLERNRRVMKEVTVEDAPASSQMRSGASNTGAGA